MTLPIKTALFFSFCLALAACTTPGKQQAMQEARQTLEEEKAKDDPCYEYKGTPDYERCQQQQYREAQREALKQQQRELLEQSRDSINDTLNRNTRDLGNL